jgi:hypothetical protein
MTPLACRDGRTGAGTGCGHGDLSAGGWDYYGDGGITRRGFFSARFSFIFFAINRAFLVCLHPIKMQTVFPENNFYYQPFYDPLLSEYRVIPG